MVSSSAEQNPPLASLDEIKAILGDIDSDKLLAIVELRPTSADLEMALLSLEGDADVYGAGEPLKGTAAEIVAILTEGEEDEEAQPPA